MNHLRNVATVILILLAVGMLAACRATGPLIPISVPVPVPCPESEPERPAMPTESLPADSDLDRFVKASQAEIERREGYEGELRTALRNCIKPIGP